MVDYVISARAVSRGHFIPEPGNIRYLRVPTGDLPEPSHVIRPTTWFQEVMNLATVIDDHHIGQKGGDIVVFVHGYAADSETIMKRHRALQDGLKAAGFWGLVVSFDWPCGEQVTAYLEDRGDATITAVNLVRGGLRLFAGYARPDCPLNVHVVAHSTGGLVIREAFRGADNSDVAATAWTISQLILISADISSESMEAGSALTDSMARHAKRITNYTNPYDWVLQISNAKRLGIAPRLGRSGLPANAPDNCVDVDCGSHFRALAEPAKPPFTPWAHSWQMADPAWYSDLAETLKGELVASVLPTRVVEDGKLVLR
jgi:pimeloyl-ACP methyl ester carboxylesterase